jgi:hypothetical protein
MSASLDWRQLAPVRCRVHVARTPTAETSHPECRRFPFGMVVNGIPVEVVPA